MRRMRSIVLALASLVGGTAGAADNGFYFGVSGGQAEYDFEPLRLSAPLVLPGPIPAIPGSGWTFFNPYTPPTVTQSLNPGSYNSLIIGATGSLAAPGFVRSQEVFWIPGKDDKAITWNVLAGYRFSKFIAIEAAYHDFGTLSEYSPSRTLGPITTVEVKSEMESTGATLAVLGSLPITDQWDVYLRAGGLLADQEVSRRIGPRQFEDSYDSEVFLYGIGTQVDFGAHWTVRLDFQRYDDVGKGNGIGEADVDVLGLGVLFRL